MVYIYCVVYLNNCDEIYLICGRLIFEETALSCRRIWVLIALLPGRLNIINGRSKELVLKQTRIGQAIACCFAAISLLFTCLWWVIIGLVNGGKARLPIVVRPAGGNERKNRLNKYVNNFAINVNKNDRLMFLDFFSSFFFSFLFFLLQNFLPKYKLFIQSTAATATTMATLAKSKFMQTRSNSIVRCCMYVCLAQGDPNDS